MNTGQKIGYFLLGTGVGMFAATLAYEHELRKPIGEEEPYISKSELENTSMTEVVDTSSNDISTVESLTTKYKTDKNDLETRAQQRRQHADDIRGKNQATRYSTMYKDGGMSQDQVAIADARRKLDAQAQANAEYSAKIFEDGPSDDGSYDDDLVAADNDLVRERVENHIEIYLGDAPQDFVTLIFYEEDNTLADDREEIVPAADEVVGTVALSRLINGGPGAENGVIFVRNLKTMINYEVVLDAGSYSDTVLGILNSRLNKGAGGDVDRR